MFCPRSLSKSAAELVLEPRGENVSRETQPDHKEGQDYSGSSMVMSVGCVSEAREFWRDTSCETIWSSKEF